MDLSMEQSNPHRDPVQHEGQTMDIEKMNSIEEQTARSGKYYPWVVVLTSLSNLTINRGTRNSFAVFLVAMSEVFHWSRAEISGVFSVYSLAGGVLGPLMGRLIDKFQVHRIVPISACVLALGLILSGMVTKLWHFYVTFGLIMAVGTTGTSIMPHTLIISRWFQVRRGLPISCALTGMGVGIFIVVPLAQYLIDTVGWRSAFMYLGVLVLCLVVPISFFVFRKEVPPSSIQNTPPGQTASQAYSQGEGEVIWTLRLCRRTLFFWAVCCIYIFSSFGMSSVVIHLVAYLVDVGYPRMTAAMVLSLVGLLSVPGRILFGLLTDRYSGRFSLITSFTCSNLGILALVSLYYIKLSVMLYVFVVLFGLAFGARTAAIGPMAAARFQGPHFGAIFGFFLLSQNIGAMAGPWLMGYLFDISKDYRLAFLIASASLVMAIISSSLTGQKKSS